MLISDSSSTKVVLPVLWHRHHERLRVPGSKPLTYCDFQSEVYAWRIVKGFGQEKTKIKALPECQKTDKILTWAFWLLKQWFFCQSRKVQRTRGFKGTLLVRCRYLKLLISIDSRQTGSSRGWSWTRGGRRPTGTLSASALSTRRNRTEEPRNRNVSNLSESSIKEFKFNSFAGCPNLLLTITWTYWLLKDCMHYQRIVRANNVSLHYCSCEDSLITLPPILG